LLDSKLLTKDSSLDGSRLWDKNLCSQKSAHPKQR
jgi:hypothetical protein